MGDEIMSDISDQLISMGKMTIADAEQQFIAKLVESIPSPTVRAAIVTVCKDLIQNDSSIKKIIIDAAASAAKQAGMVRR